MTTTQAWITLDLIGLCGLAIYIVLALFKEDGTR